MESSGTSRRRFLGTAAGAAGVAMGASVWGLSNRAEAAGRDRAFVAGKYALEIDGLMAGWVHSAEGGHAVADVVNEKLGPSHIAKKHIGGVKYEDISIDMGFSMSKAVYAWIAASWSAQYQRKNGAIVAADFDLNAKSEREFFNALITETTIPACDGASKEPAYMTVKFAPEYTRWKAASGKFSGGATAKDSPQRLWLPSNFRLEIDGLDCTKVNKIDAFTVKQSIVESPVGEVRDYLKEPAALEFPNLRVQFSEASAASWRAWFESFVIGGNSDDSQEKSGTLTFLSPNRQTELAKVQFFNVGIFKLSDDPPPDGDDSAAKIRRWTADLYVERMQLTVFPPFA